MARRRIGKPLGELAPDADRVWRSSAEGEPIDLLLAGDSNAAGLGADRRKTPSAGASRKERAGAHPVSLRRAAAAVFISHPDEMFSLDRFHPGALGYRRMAEALLQPVIEALEAPQA